MFSKNLFDHKALRAQVLRQKKHAWDLSKDINWGQGIDPKRYLLPLDNDAVAFPGASAEQKLALSQLLGLIINSTIAEMEDVITKLRTTAWENILRSYPVNPEMWELGELFFEEETKHSLAFSQYNQIFCQSQGINRESLDLILPKAYGSLFLKAIVKNAKWGGHAFWWVVAAVEEVSIEIYREMNRHRSTIDPLYFEVHFKHMEEESRHHNYAFLMLEIINRRDPGLFSTFHKKTDLLIAQIFSTGWVIAELNKVFEAKRFKNEHPFFETIASCAPLLKNLPPHELARRLFISAPYISLVLNTGHHRLTSASAQRHHAFSIPFPSPSAVETFAPIGETPRRKKKVV
jgi:hypothetical protein